MAKEMAHGSTESRTALSQMNSEVYVPTTEKRMLIAPAGLFAQFCDHLYSQLESVAAVRGGALPFTSEEFTSYNATALRTRIDHVNRSRVRNLGITRVPYSVHEGWAILPAMQFVLASIGEAKFGPANILLYPVMSDQVVLLEKADRDVMTARVRGVAGALNTRIHDDLPKDNDGHKQVMVLTYDAVREGWFSPIGEMTVEDAVVAAIVGLTDEVALVEGTVSALWMPQVHVKHHTAVHYISELARVTM